jgi:predicted nucleotidyltransferase
MTTRIEAAPEQQLDAAVESWPSAAARAEAHHLVRALCEDSCVDAVVVFGSAVRPRVRSYDLDMLFVYNGSKPKLSSRRMEVDLRSYSRAEVTSLLERGHDLISWAIRFGKVVCQRDRYWERLTSKWIDSLPLPSVAETDERSKKAWTLFTDLVELGDIDAALEQYITYLTHRARICLVRSNVYPASRPELPGQLRDIGARSLAQNLEQALRRRQLRTEGRADRLEQFLGASKRIGARFNGS